MTRNFIFAPNEHYHIYNRGTEKRKIFLNYKGYERFQFLLYICNNINSIEIRNYGGLTSVDLFLGHKKAKMYYISARSSAG